MGPVELIVLAILFMASCSSLGYLAGVWIRRRSWPEKVCLVTSVLIALLWPTIIMSFVLYSVIITGPERAQPTWVPRSC